MGAGGGALAWEYLGRNPEYRAAWAAQSVAPQAPSFEAGPFPEHPVGFELTACF